MKENQDSRKINFAPFALEDKPLYEEYLSLERGRGCEFSFANLYLWGRQSFALLYNSIILFSQFSRRTVYPYPLGGEDKKEVLDAVIADAHERGIPCRITGISDEARELIESLYPNKFRFHSDEGSYDYVYSIDDLAELRGKKYHGKRNHLKRFTDAYPDYTVVPIDGENVRKAEQFAEEWYERRLLENPDSDFHMERAALKRAFRDYGKLELEGLLLISGDDVLGFTVASRLSKDTFDVHFEKARGDIQGAYPAINCEFARYIRNKYPDVLYLDREEDMGLEGLRKAKQSYHPHHMVKKYWACLLEDGYDY